MHANDNNRRRTCGRKPLATTCANVREPDQAAGSLSATVRGRNRQNRGRPDKGEADASGNLIARESPQHGHRACGPIITRHASAYVSNLSIRESRLMTPFIKDTRWPVDDASLAALWDIGLNAIEIARYSGSSGIPNSCQLAESRGERRCR